MMKEIRYEPLQTVMLRTPLFPLNMLFELFKTNKIHDESYKNILRNQYFLEAIKIASDDLYKTIINLDVTDIQNNKNEKLRNAILKYYTRACTRCTPFGLFAGVSVGSVGKNTVVQIEHFESLVKKVKVDTHRLCEIIYKIKNITEVMKELKYFPNETIYLIGKHIRYLESIYVNGVPTYNISTVDYLDELASVLECCQDGMRLNELINILVERGYAYDEAEGFITELVNSKILLSELEPTLSGDDYLSSCISIFERIGIKTQSTDLLKSVSEELNNYMSVKVGNGIGSIEKIKSKMLLLSENVENNNIIQVDVFKPLQKCQLNESLIHSLRNAIPYLKTFHELKINQAMLQFRESFLNRYENKFIPLLEALDPEYGLGYSDSMISKDVSPIIEGIQVTSTAKTTLEISNIDIFLLQKINESIKNNEEEIILNNDDIKKIKMDWSDLPDTITSLVQYFIGKDGKERVVLKAMGGANAVSYIGRFGHLDKKIEDSIEEIYRKEDELNNNKIVAEIIHLPQLRAGNILYRNKTRKYEISYLAKTSVAKAYQIPINDILVGIKGDKIILLNRRSKKEIVPKLSVAHNYIDGSLPIYKFLCDIQTYNKHPYLHFKWGKWENVFNYLPRVRFNNIILSLARWTINAKEFQQMPKNNDVELMKGMLKLRTKLNLPEWVSVIEGDNELPICLANIDSVRVFLSMIKNKSRILVSEFLYDNNLGLNCDNNNYYAGQFIINFTKEESNGTVN